MQGMLFPAVPPRETATAELSLCGRYRYSLARTWDTALPSWLWIMLNPSTADAEVDDPTIRRVRGFSRDGGAGGFVVVNLYPLRATDPDELRFWRDNSASDRNLAVIRGELAKGPARVVVAYGAHKLASARAGLLMRHLRPALGDDVWCLGETADGWPRHPLYVPGDAPLVRYPAAATGV